MYCNPYTFYGKHKLFCENLGTALDHYNHNKNIKLDFRCIRFPGIISKNTIPTGGTSDYAPEMILAAKKMVPYSCFVSKESKLPFIVMPDAINAIIKLMSSSKNKLTSNVYNITSFSPSVGDFYKEISLYYKNFNLTYNINKNRQSIVNSWPGIIDDSKAKKDWDWKPNYNFLKVHLEIIFIKIMKKIQKQINDLLTQIKNDGLFKMKESFLHNKMLIL